ncbi:MAG TPA: MoaD/ThiS family protein [Actinomycetota bacterium]|nr:MoaD/ThiS family protein [Actinomycetota bacterium]
MAVVVLRAPLKDLADGNGSVRVNGSTVLESLRDLEATYPRMAGWVLDETGTVRRHVNVFIDANRVEGDATVETDTEITVIHAISGGNS